MVCEAYSTSSRDTFPWLSELVGHGADVNDRRVLDHCSGCNVELVSRLVELGADVRGGWNEYTLQLASPMHCIYAMSRPVFDVLVGGGAEVDFKDSEGCTPLMDLMQLPVGTHDEDEIKGKFGWLVSNGASCLTTNNEGRGLLDTERGGGPPFTRMISDRVRQENWGRRGGFVLVRDRLSKGAVQPVACVDRFSSLVAGLVTTGSEGVFRHIVGYV